MEPGIIILLTLMAVVLSAVSVFFIILLIRLTKLTKSAEETLSIVNKKLPESLDNLSRLIDHAESSLDELDVTLRRVQEPIDDFSRITKTSKNLIKNFSSGISNRNPGQIMEAMGGNLSRVLISALTGGIAALIRKLIKDKFGNKKGQKADA